MTFSSFCGLPPRRLLDRQSSGKCSIRNLSALREAEMPMKRHLETVVECREISAKSNRNFTCNSFATAP